jgi:hypothetical protein
MEILVKIKTPQGQASGTDLKLRPYIVGLLKQNTIKEIKIGKDDDKIYWRIETDYKHIQNINRNVAFFDSGIRMMMGHPIMRKFIKSNIKKEDQIELEKMLKNQTKLTIISKEEFGLD